MIAVDEAWFLF